MTDEFENALAWFHAAPDRWFSETRGDITALAEWVWEVLQGDFHEDASTGQVALGTVISMIPFVDQLCDVRDLIANCRKIDKEPTESWHWVALGLTLIGLFPSLGSLLKGCGKVAFSSIRKAGHVSGAAPEIAKCIEQAVAQLNKFLARPEVVKTLKSLQIDNPYKYLATEFRKLSVQINTSRLLQAFDSAKNAAESLLDLVKKWGGAALADQIAGLLKAIDRVRRLADQKLAQVIAPLQEIIDKLARRLDIEADMAHRAHVNQVNPHAFKRISADMEETELKNSKPPWINDNEIEKLEKIKKSPHTPPGWKSTEINDADPDHPLTNAHKTFNTMQAITLPPGTKIYRIIDPRSGDNSICWMSENEFLQLTSKSEWRRRFAVWNSWNSNGEYVTYTVPSGKGLKVWEGITASQSMKNTKYFLKGGGHQIVVNPTDLTKGMMGKRKLTDWGYGDHYSETDLVGVPTLKNNWFGK